MSAKDNLTGIESVHNINTQGARRIVQDVGGARSIPTVPRISQELREAGAQQAGLGKISEDPHPDILKAVTSQSEDPTTGSGWFEVLSGRASRKAA